MRENEIINDSFLKNARIYDDETLDNLKKYYNIDDHSDLLKFIKLNGLTNNHVHNYDKE